MLKLDTGYVLQSAAPIESEAGILCFGGGKNWRIYEFGEFRREVVAVPRAPLEAMSNEQAERYKAQGNTALAGGMTEEAVRLYTLAVREDPFCEVYFSNRSAANATLARFKEALEDADEVVRLKPAWVKGHTRRGAALSGLKKHEEARKAYLKACDFDPGNAQARELMEAEAKSARQEQEMKDHLKRVKEADAAAAAEAKKEEARAQARATEEASAAAAADAKKKMAGAAAAAEEKRTAVSVMGARKIGEAAAAAVEERLRYAIE